MKGRKGNLFDLVHSLSMSEKRYFKTYSSNMNKDFIKLFDLINLQSEYHEESLKKEFAGKNLSSLKKYLQEKLLDSLRAFYARHNERKQVGLMLSNMEILQFKGLHKLLGKEIKKAKKIAEKYNMYYELIQIFDYERKLLTHYEFDKVSNEYLEEVCTKAKNNLKIFNNIMDYLMVELALNFSTTKKENELKLLDSLMNESFMKNEEEAISFFSRNLFYSLNGHYALKNQENEKALHYFQNGVNYWLKFPELVDHYFTHFTTVYVNYLISLIESEDEITAQTELDKFKEMTSAHLESNIETDYERFSIINSRYILEVNLIFIKSNLDSVEHTHLEILEFLKENEQWLDESRKVFYYFFLTYAKVHLKQFNKAVDLSSKILNELDFNYNLKYLPVSIVLFFISHYEMGNNKFIKNQLRRYRNILRQNNIYNKFMESFVNLISNLHNGRFLNQHKDIFERAQKEFNEIENIPEFEVYFAYTKINAWIEEKIIQNS